MSVDVHGTCDPRFESVRRTFADNLESGADVGAAFAVTMNGEMVVDLWGGWADPGMTRPWERDTLVNVYSTTKTMTALTALLLADRGQLDFHAPVARYWPEFAANGKSGVTVAHLMSHSSGLSGWKEPITVEDLYDWEKATALLAAQAPFWEPGPAPGYHGMTQGYLVGEVVRRITGASLGTVVRTEIAEPLGADFHIGLPASEDHRVAELIPPPAAMAMPAPSPGSTPSSPTAAKSTAGATCPRPAAAGPWSARSRARTWSCTSPPASASASASPAPPCRRPTPTRSSGAATAGPWPSSTWMPARPSATP